MGAAAPTNCAGLPHALVLSLIHISHWPDPFRKIVWGLLLASSFTETFAVLLPVAVGLNVIVMVQLLPPGMVIDAVGQLFV